jgi:hypothetical protein
VYLIDRSRFHPLQVEPEYLESKDGVNGSSPLEGHAFSKLGISSRAELA